METIALHTIDKIELSALFWNRKASSSILLLHAMPATKESWQELAEELYTQGCNVFAIDFRGHGQSTGGNYKEFSQKQHQNYFLDARRALRFLEETFPNSRTAIVGASIGANIALQCLTHDEQLEKAVCLSAGVDYYGVRAIDFVKDLHSNQRVLFVGSSDDAQGGTTATEQAETLVQKANTSADKIIFETGGHGTNMFSSHPELMGAIIEFLAI